jgi:uncharacterized membrane protein/ribosomal protein L40E
MELIEPGLKLCSHCAFQMPQTAAFCPGCGQKMLTRPKTQEKGDDVRENIIGALAYITFVPAILFLLRNPYRRNRFVRFHSVQCLVLWLIGIVLGLALRLIGMLVFLIPVLGPLLVVILTVVFILAAGLLWFVLIIKALQGETFMVLWVGDVSSQYADIQDQS